MIVTMHVERSAIEDISYVGKSVRSVRGPDSMLPSVK